MNINQYASNIKYVGETGTKYNNYMVTIVPPKSLEECDGEGDRNNIMVSLVIDISYSMDDKVSVENAETGVRENNGMTILDIVKHAAITVIKSLCENDFASIIVYSTEATVINDIIRLTDVNKETLITKISALQTTGQTNIWDGLYKGLQTLNNTPISNIIQTVMLLTDGQPNINPPRGILNMLEKYKDSGNMNCSINTFGFGFNLDSRMLKDISNIGNGMYAFCPDANFVGTTFCNILSNEMVTYAHDVSLSLTGNDDFIVKKTNLVEDFGNNCNECSWGVKINLGNLRFGQTRNIILKLPEWQETFIESCIVKYTDISNMDLGQKECRTSTISITTEVIQINIMENITRSHLSTGIQYLVSNMGSQEHYKNLMPIMEGFHYIESAYIDAIMKEYTGQIEEAIRPEYYIKWGRHYLASLHLAHMKEECTNFKDHAIQFYGGDLFIKYRDMVEEVFVSTPPPVPSRPIMYNQSSRVVQAPEQTPINMRNYFNQSGGCIAAHCVVKMEDSSIKFVSEIMVGDVVSNGFIIQQIVKFKVDNYMMIRMPTGLIISPYHPVMHYQYAPEWSNPINCGDEIIYDSKYVYNFVLNTGHTMVINDIQVITLGHGYVNGILKHSYLGTIAVINDLTDIGIDKDGYVNVTYIDRDLKGDISKFR